MRFFIKRRIRISRENGYINSFGVEFKLIDQELIDIEDQFKEKLGTRVRIEKREEGGRVTIDFFNKDDLRALLERIVSGEETSIENIPALTEEEKILAEDEPEGGNDESLYSVTNFSI